MCFRVYGMLLADAIARFEPKLPLAVAYSGGADSSALLLACARRWPGLVTAVHVNHGLQANADFFENHCQNTCRLHNIDLVVKRVHAHPSIGQSPEEAARKARYLALDEVVRQSHQGHEDKKFQSFGLAHHADDQVETLLLALTRGAGVAGLAGMPAMWDRCGIRWFRPLLDVSSQAIRAWLNAHGHAWIDDPTNADIKYTRNRIRHQILPAIAVAAPSFREVFARSMRHCGQAKELLHDLAQLDLNEVGVPPDLKRLQALSAARKANVIRFWLNQYHHTTPSAAQLDELIRQIDVCCTRGHGIHLKVGSGYVQRFDNKLRWYNHV